MPNYNVFSCGYFRRDCLKGKGVAPQCPAPAPTVPASIPIQAASALPAICHPVNRLQCSLGPGCISLSIVPMLDWVLHTDLASPTRGKTGGNLCYSLLADASCDSEY